MLPLMREAAIRLLNTLSHQDYFYIWLNHNDGSRYNDSFVRTNQSNRQLLEQFITSATTQQLTPTLNIALQLEEAFQLFRYLHTIIIMFISVCVCVRVRVLGMGN